MNFQAIPVNRRDELLNHLGVDPVYFGVNDYDQAKVASSYEKVKMLYEDLSATFEKLFSNLNITTDMEYHEPETDIA